MKDDGNVPVFESHSMRGHFEDLFAVYSEINMIVR